MKVVPDGISSGIGNSYVGGLGTGFDKDSYGIALMLDK